jgi:hypothetical protein
MMSDMTCKQRVLAVYPDATIARDHHSAYYAFTKKGAGGRISGYVGSEELVWQSAARNLPAASPEAKKGLTVDEFCENLTKAGVTSLAPPVTKPAPDAAKGESMAAGDEMCACDDWGTDLCHLHKQSCISCGQMLPPNLRGTAINDASKPSLSPEMEQLVDLCREMTTHALRTPNMRRYDVRRIALMMQRLLGKIGGSYGS